MNILLSFADNKYPKLNNNNYRDIITKNLNMWTSLHDEYESSNGKTGQKNDSHWNSKMHKVFAEHIIKSYPQYFGYESKIL